MRKRILSALLAVLLLAALSVPALASGEPEPVDAAEETVAEETVVGEPVTEEDLVFEDDPAAEGEPIEVPEPAIEVPEPAIEAPAADGLKVYGEYHVSQFAEQTPLELTDTTTLIVDCNKTLAGITGSETLYIRLQEGCTLTVGKPGGHAISVSTLYVSGPGTLMVNGGKDALNVDLRVDLRNTNVFLNAGWDGIFSRSSDVYIMGSTVEVTAGEDAVDLKGILTIENSDCTLDGEDYGIRSRGGRVTFTGSAIRASGSGAGVYVPDGFLESDGPLRVRSTNYKEAYENFAIYAKGNITLKNGPVDVRGSFGGICSREGSILCVDCDMDVTAKLTAGLLAAEYISISGGDIGVLANDQSTSSGFPNAGMRAKGIGIGGGADVFVAGKTALDASEYINIGAPTIADGIDWGLSVWSSNPAGKSLTIQISDYLRAQGDQGAVQVTSGTIELLPACEIVTPAGGRVGTYQPHQATAILRPDGGIATEAVVQKAAPAPTRVSSASITVTAPRDGQTMRADGVPADGSRYAIRQQGWYNSLDLSDRASGTFVNGRSYYYSALLEPKDGYVFPTTSDGKTGPLYYSSVFDARVNGEQASTMYWYAEPQTAYGGTKAGAIRIFVYLTATGDTYGGDIALTGLVMPAAGRSTASNVTLNNSAVRIDSQGWYDTADTAKGPTGDKSFQPGKTYYWICDMSVRSGANFEMGSGNDYVGKLTLNGKTVPRLNLLEYMAAGLAGEEYTGYLYQEYGKGLRIALIRITPDAPAAPTVKLSSDGRTATATGFAGLYARVALVLQNGGTSGLYVTQVTINPDGTIVIPSFTVPGLTVKGVNIALVPTLADISSPQPNVKASDFKML